MAKTTFDIKTEATRYLHAGVGAADLAVEAVRDYVADVSAKAGHLQKSVQKNVAGIDYDPTALREQALTAVNARVDALSADAKSTRAAIEARLLELQTQLQAAAGETYTELAKRGEDLVGRIRKQESTKAAVVSAKTTVAKAKTTKTQATKAAGVAKTAAKSTAKSTAASTAKTATTATKTAKKTAAKKAAPVKKSAATAESSAKATVTAAKKTVTHTVDAVVDAAEKIGD